MKITTTMAEMAKTMITMTTRKDNDDKNGI